MHKMERRFLDGVRENIRGSSLDTCYRWSCARRFMQPVASKPGFWYSGRDYPWVKEILNTRARFNWVMKGAQVGLTECGINRGLFETDYHGRDVMYLLPTDKAAILFSRTRFDNAIKLSPYLADRVKVTNEVKQIGTASLFVRGANGDINVKSTPISRMLMDEIEEMDEAQIHLAIERCSGQHDPIIWGMSTPKFPNAGIHKFYLTSTQEHFFFPCPHCHKKIELRWPESIHLAGESVEDPRCRESYLKCYECNGKLPHEHKRQWLGGGFWEATAVDADPENRGFKLNQLYSPTVSPVQFAVAYHRGRGDEKARREFHNSKLGEPYVEDGSQVQDAHIDACTNVIAPYGLNSDIPMNGDELITLGVDQGKFHHWVAVKWTIRKGVAGDANDKAFGKLIGLGRVFQDNWSELYQLMARYQVRMAAIDFFPEQTQARRFGKQFPGFVWCVQYVTGRGAREISMSEDEYGANVAKVDKAGWLSKSLGRVMNREIAFPADIPWEFRRQLKNQVREFKMSTEGNYVAEYTRLSDDHWGHALNYAEIALNILDPSLHDSDTMTSFG